MPASACTTRPYEFDAEYTGGGVAEKPKRKRNNKDERRLAD